MSLTALAYAIASSLVGFCIGRMTASSDTPVEAVTKLQRELDKMRKSNLALASSKPQSSDGDGTFFAMVFVVGCVVGGWFYFFR